MGLARDLRGRSRVRLFPSGSAGSVAPGSSGPETVRASSTSRSGTRNELESGEAKPRARLYHHRLGDRPEKDTLLFEGDNPSLLLGPKLGDEGRYLVLSLFEGTRRKNRVVYRDLEEGLGGAWHPLIEEADAGYVFEGNVGRRFFFRTTLDAPRGRILAVRLDHPERPSWQELIPERQSSLNTVSRIGDRLVVTSTLDARPIIEVFGTDGTHQTTVQLPSLGLISGLGDDPEANETFYRLNSLTDPGTIYRLDLGYWREPPLPSPGARLRSGRVRARAALLREPGRHPRADLSRPSEGHREERQEPHSSCTAMDTAGGTAFPWFQPHLVGVARAGRRLCAAGATGRRRVWR